MERCRGSSPRLGAGRPLTVTEYAAVLYLGGKVGYRRALAASRCHAVAAFCAEGPMQGGRVRTSRAGKCQQAETQVDGTSICSGTLRGIDRMTYWTAPAASRPATRMAAAMTATPAGFVKTLALCVSLT